jgi:predicted transcriptional regulator of viral defense system
MKNPQDQILALAEERGVIRPSDLQQLLLDPRYLRALVTEGRLIRTGRGLYSLATFDITERHNMVEAVRTQSKGVVCLLSSLSFHGLGTQLPHQIWLAVPYGARITANDTVPLRITVMRPSSYGAGIDIHQVEGVDVPVYNIAKTVADCFKFRGKVGFDVALEALREAMREKRCDREEIRKYAQIDRVENVMRPYMEAFAI